jgi:hypothetical protein
VQSKVKKAGLGASRNVKKKKGFDLNYKRRILSQVPDLFIKSFKIDNERVSASH